VIIASGAHRTKEELFTTLKHEVYGHLATYRMEEREKSQLLTSIQKMKHTDLINEWAKVKEVYSDLPERKQAEEVFSSIAEKIDMGFTFIKEVKYTPTSLKEVQNIVHHIKNEFITNMAIQKIHPRQNDLQFSKSIYKEQSMAQEKDPGNTITIREAKIIEVPKEQLNPQETSFDSRKEAIIHQVASGNTHNFSEQDKKVLSKNFKEITSKAYKNYPTKIQQSKSTELKKNMREKSVEEKVKSFCKERDAKQKEPEKSLGIER
jgi:hypothetical protein